MGQVSDGVCHQLGLQSLLRPPTWDAISTPPCPTDTVCGWSPTPQGTLPQGHSTLSPPGMLLLAGTAPACLLLPDVWLSCWWVPGIEAVLLPPLSPGCPSFCCRCPRAGLWVPAGFTACPVAFHEPLLLPIGCTVKSVCDSLLVSGLINPSLGKH